MISRPFTTNCHSAPLPGSGNLQIIVDFKPIDLTQDILDRLRRPFLGLTEMAQWGGMAGEKHQPEHSTMLLVNNGERVGPHTIRWDFNALNIDSGAAYVIQNIVHYLHLFVTPVETLMVRSQLVRDGAIICEDLPSDFEPSPFEIQDERETTTVLVDVDFVSRQTPLAAEPFRRAWNGWYDVAAHGGFCSEDYPPNEVSINIEDDLKVTSTGIGCVFDDVVIDDAGFSCLINMLQVLHHRLTPISEVTIS